MEVTDKQLSEMKHALGLDYKKKPFRNRFVISKDNKNWNDLVEKGLAKSNKLSFDSNNFIFWLTKEGVEFVLGKKISSTKYNEL